MPTTSKKTHECDLFLLTSHAPWYADRSLESFSILGNNNIDGWGIGSYQNGRAKIIKSEDPASIKEQVSKEFNIAMKAISSKIIIGHLRLTSSSSTSVENNHPFKLNFLDYDWTFMHNGTGYNIHQLVSENERILWESTNDSAKAFEYIRKKAIEYYYQNHKKSLIEAVRQAYSKLLEEDPHGKYNIILSNGYLNWCFIHWRPFYLLNREKTLGNVSIISTIKLNNSESWIEFNSLPNYKAKMLVFNGHSLIYNGDIK